MNYDSWLIDSAYIEWQPSDMYVPTLFLKTVRKPLAKEFFLLRDARLSKGSSKTRHPYINWVPKIGQSNLHQYANVYKLDTRELVSYLANKVRKGTKLADYVLKRVGR